MLTLNVIDEKWQDSYRSLVNQMLRSLSSVTIQKYDQPVLNFAQGRLTLLDGARAILVQSGR